MIVSRLRLDPLYISVLLLCVLAMGCQKETATTDLAGLPDRSPEESFDRIVRYLRTQVERPFIDTSRGLGNYEISTLTHSSTLSHELFKPDKNRTTYTARITIETSHTYASKQLTPDEPTKDPTKEKKPLDSNNIFVGENPEDPLGLSTESSTLSGASQSAPKDGHSTSSEREDSGLPVIQRSSKTWKDIIDLKYENNRWVVTSEIESDWLRSTVERSLILQ